MKKHSSDLPEVALVPLQVPNPGKVVSSLPYWWLDIELDSGRLPGKYSFLREQLTMFKTLILLVKAGHVSNDG